MQQVLDKRWGGEDEQGFEMTPVLHQTRYGYLDLAEFTMHGQKEPDTRCSAKIKMYTK